MESATRPIHEALPVQPLLQESPPPADLGKLPSALRSDLGQLAASTDSLADRSERFYGSLRKRLGTSELTEVLRGVAVLARECDPAGARLLAALLDVHAPGAEMIARIHKFDSSRRLRRRLAMERPPSGVPRQWLRRFDDLRGACERRVEEAPAAAPPAAAQRPRDEAPFPLLRRCLELLLGELARHGDLNATDQELLVGLARLEVDAYEKRVGRIASDVNPYSGSVVARVLPLLSQADAEIRAMRDFMQSVEGGRAGLAFRQRIPRLHEALAPPERAQLMAQLEGAPDLAPLASLLRGLERKPVPLRRLAATVARVTVLAGVLRDRGLRATDLDLLSAVQLAQRFEADGELRLPLGQELQAIVSEWLAPPASAADAAAELLAARGQVAQRFAGWPRDGFCLLEDLLILRVPEEGRADRSWRDDLPTHTPAEPGGKDEEASVAELKRLVFANLDNVSVTLGFLQNAKIISVPGLVAGIAARCRCARVLEVIAADRRLHSGYANKDVPRTLLLSPCNIPIKSLQKFIHVKFVNKIDLQRMARDKAGVRREVCREIEAYLDSLSH